MRGKAGTRRMSTSQTVQILPVLESGTAGWELVDGARCVPDAGKDEQPSSAPSDLWPEGSCRSL